MINNSNLSDKATVSSFKASGAFTLTAQTFGLQSNQVAAKIDLLKVEILKKSVEVLQVMEGLRAPAQTYSSHGI